MSEVHYLRRLHNLAIGLGWLALPVLAPKLWPKPQYKIKRGITPDEHAKILADVKNAERNFYYQLLWEIGASQSDAAALTTENIDWPLPDVDVFPHEDRRAGSDGDQQTIGSDLEPVAHRRSVVSIHRQDQR